MNRTFRTLKMLAAAAVALSALSVAGTAQAYDSSTCNGLFGGANVSRTDSINMERGRVDFGDHAHVAGFPLGYAVICWSIDGRVAIQGHVYSDPGIFHAENQYATARITFFRSNGVAVSGGTYGTNLSNSLQSKPVFRVSPAGNFTRVRIRLSYTNESGAETFYPAREFGR